MATTTPRTKRARTAIGTAKAPRTPPQATVHLDRADEERTENPLRTGLLLEKIPAPCSIVVFGATGDLTSRKILPAIYNLRRAGLLPAEATVVGFSRRQLSDQDFRKLAKGSLDEHSRVKPEEGL